MTARIVLVEAGGAPPGFGALLDRVAADLQLPLDRFASLEAGVDGLSGVTAPTVIVMAAASGKPMSIARQLGKQVPQGRFVFVAPAEAVDRLRREAVVGAPTGGRWVVSSDEPSALLSAIADASSVASAQHKLRTTLDRANLSLSSVDPVDSHEYRRLLVSDRYLASVLQSAHDAIVSLDLNGSVVTWNRAASRMFSISEHQARRSDFMSLFVDKAQCRSDLNAAFSGRKTQSQWLLATTVGETRNIDVVLDVMRDDERRVLSLVVILRDVTERHAAERASTEASRQKDEFLAMLSHELRNPLAPIQNAAAVLQILTSDDPRAQRATSIITRQVEHLTALVDDLLDVARVTRGTITLECEPVSLNAVLADSIEQARALIEVRHHCLHVTGFERVVSVNGDRKRLTQVFTNLLVNAAKYTAEGGRIDVGLVEEPTGAAVVVADNGSGIDAPLLPHIFEMFTQGARSAERAQGGLGIGLPLVKDLVKRHGGSIVAASDGQGRGSTFTVRLPRLEIALPPQLPQADRPVRVEGERLNLMVVDDNADAAEMLSELLQSAGHLVEVAVDPREALARATLVDPDVFILDIGMPHMDGYELARRLNGVFGGRARPILIALTGYGSESDKEQARLAGFDHHLVKPLDANTLYMVLDEIHPKTRH